jgi:hypothetical protein
MEVIAKLTEMVSKGASGRVVNFVEAPSLSGSDSIVINRGNDLQFEIREKEKLIEKAQAEYDKRHEHAEATVIQVKNKLENVGKQRLAHEKLRRDAEELQTHSEELISQATFTVEDMVKQRNQAREEEIAFENARAESHERAVKAEQKRIEAQAELLLNQQRLKHAKELQEYHTQGIQFTDLLTRKHELELNESTIVLEKTSFIKSNVQALIKGAEFKPSHFEFEVGVQPQPLPEAHIYSTSLAKGVTLRGVLEEKVQVPALKETSEVTVTKEKFRGVKTESSEKKIKEVRHR